MIIRALLPEEHLSAETKDVVKLGMGLIGTMTVLVLGLLVASAKSGYDTQRNGVATARRQCDLSGSDLGTLRTGGKRGAKCCVPCLRT